jgi:hypothetical protein
MIFRGCAAESCDSDIGSVLVTLVFEAEAELSQRLRQERQRNGQWRVAGFGCSSGPSL